MDGYVVDADHVVVGGLAAVDVLAGNVLTVGLIVDDVSLAVDDVSLLGLVFNDLVDVVVLGFSFLLSHLLFLPPHCHQADAVGVVGLHPIGLHLGDGGLVPVGPGPGFGEVRTA